MSENMNENVQENKVNIFTSLLASKYSNYISVLITSMSLLLWGVSIIQAKSVRIGNYGLFSVLPVTYYVAVFLLLASMFYTLFGAHKKGKFHIYLLIIQSLLLMIFILFTPSLIEGVTRSSHSWLKYSYVDYLVRNSHIEWGGYYANTPMMFIFSAELVQLTGFDPFSFPLIFPLIMDFIIFIFILLFCFKFFKELKFRIMAIMLFFLITWENQFHFVPQMFGFVIMILTVYLITFYWKKADWKIILITGMLIVVLTFTHLLTSVVVCTYLGLIIIYQLFWTRKEQKNMPQKKRKKFKTRWLLNKRFWYVYWKKSLRKKIKWLLSQKLFIYSVLLGIGVLAIWWYFAGNWVRTYNWNLSFSSIVIQASTYIDKLYSGSNAHGNLVLLRMIFSAIVALIAIIGGKMAYDKGQTRIMYLFLISSIIPMFLFNYEAEIIQRTYLFSGLPLALLISMGINKKKFLTLIVACSFLAVPVHILAHYGNEKIDYTPASEVAGAKYIFNHVDTGFIIFGGGVVSSQYSENFSIISLDYFLDNPNIEGDVYLLYTSSSQYWLEWYTDDDTVLPQINRYITENEPILIHFTPDCIIYKLN